MKKPLIFFACLLIIASTFYSCSNDDDTTPPVIIVPEEEDGNSETVNLETIIQEIISTNANGWKIATANLSNNTVTNLDITDLYNVQDDRFELSAASINEIRISWLEAYEINSNAIDLENVKSDNYKRSSQTIVTSTSTTSPYIFTNSDGSVELTYTADSATLTGKIRSQNGIEITAITFTSVTTADFQTIETPQNFELIFSANTSQPVIGLNYSFATNSLFAMAHNFQNVSVYRYEESNQEINSISTTDDAIGSDQFEFIDGRIKWVSAFSSLNIDYNLSQFDVGNGVNFSPRQHGTTAENNTVFAVGGYDGYLGDQITTLSPSGTSFLELGNMPSERAFADVTIVDSDLYIFGGYYITPNGTISFYDSILKYDLATGTLLETIPLGLDLLDSYVSRKGELIYITGSVLVTNSNNGGIGETRRYFGVYNTATETLQEIDIDSQLPTDRRIRGFAVSEDAMYFAFDEVNPTTGFWRIDVYSASLQ